MLESGCLWQWSVTQFANYAKLDQSESNFDFELLKLKVNMEKSTQL